MNARFQRVVGLTEQKCSPPSRVSSEGGVGGGVSTEETPPPSRVSSKGGSGGAGCSNTTKRERDPSLRRVGSVEVSK